MGDGEEYWGEWMKWYLKLTKRSREDYQVLHPEPVASTWIGFYGYIDELENDGI